MHSVDPELLLCSKMTAKALVPCWRGIYVELSELRDAYEKNKFMEGPETGGTEREREKMRELCEKRVTDSSFLKTRKG